MSISSDRQRQSPQIENSSSPSPTQPPNNAHPTHSAKLNGTSGTSTTPMNEATPNDRFTLMHPAFQNTQQKRKYGNEKSFDGDEMNRNEQHSFLTNVMQSQAMDKKTVHGHRLHSHDAYFDRVNKSSCNRDDDELSVDSNDSEEIDLTSNGCIDFSNNNNNSGKAHF